MPDPESNTTKGELGSLVSMLTAALFPPVEAGVNVTLTVQLAPAARLAAQSFVCPNIAGSIDPSGPVTVTERISIGAAPPLRTVTSRGALVTPADCSPNDTTPALTCNTLDDWRTKTLMPPRAFL